MTYFSFIHLQADFIIKRKKSKKKSKRRHTFCEGQNREIEQAIRNVTNSSCQTDDLLDTTVSSSASIHRSLSKRRSRSALDNSRRKTILDELDLDSLHLESKDSATEDDKEKSPSKVCLNALEPQTKVFGNYLVLELLLLFNLLEVFLPSVNEQSNKMMKMQKNKDKISL